MQPAVIFDMDGVLVDTYHAEDLDEADLVVRQLSELPPSRIRELF